MGDEDSMNEQYRTILLNDESATDYKFRVVLTWTGSQNTSSINKDLDLFVDFEVSNKIQCSVGFYNPICYGVESSFEGQNSHTDIYAETLTFDTIGDYVYIVYVAQYLDKTSLDFTEIQETGARLDLYVEG